MDLRLKLHGGYQLEIKFHYPISPGKNHYNTEVLVGIPAALNVDSKHFDENRLFRNLTVHTRFSSPRIPVEDLFEPANGSGPLADLLSILSRHKAERNQKRINYLLKIYTNALIYHLKKTMSKENQEESLQELFVLINKVRKVFRLLSPLKAEPFFNDNVLLAETTVYLSLRKSLTKYDDELYETSQFRQVFDLLLNWEKESNLFQKLPGLSAEESDLLRTAEHKKWVQSSLYMNTKILPLYRRFAQAAGILASALAMTAAVVLTFFIQQTFRDYSLFWIVMIVSVYALKDRLKEGIKAFSSRWLPLLFPSWNYKLIDPSNGRAVGFGSCRMGFRDFSKIKPGLLDKIMCCDPVNLEGKKLNYLYLDREVMIDAGKLAKNHPELEMLSDLLRINTSEWAQNADKSSKNVVSLVKNVFTRKKTRRLYALPMRIKMTCNAAESLESFYTVYFSQSSIVSVLKVRLLE